MLGYGDCRAPYEISAGHRLVETRGAPLFAALAAFQAVGRSAFTVQKWKSAAYRRALEGLLDECWDAAVIDHAQMGWV
ncbi:hypothetical protein, partial [Escherichia coli]|uniref:hypothetical protein n=1 Tax=Escherichia coli TaxID=562 RepID=UPI003CF421C9